jgi:hypothetical protein
MIESMERRDKEATEDSIVGTKAAPQAPVDRPTVYIPACGTLCDTFWWARRSIEPTQSSD